MKKPGLVFSTIAVLLMLSLFGSVASAGSSQVGATAPAGSDSTDPPEHRRIRIVGMVAHVHENGIVLRTYRGPVRVRVTEMTTIRVPEGDECVEGTLEDIQVGEPAMVVGMLTPEHIVIARGISQCRPNTEGSEK